MDYLIHIVLALFAQVAAEEGYSARLLPVWTPLALCVVPHALGWLVRRAYLGGRFRIAEALFRALHAAPVLLSAACVLACGWLGTIERAVGVAPRLLAWPSPVLLLALLPFAVYELLAIDARARIGGATASALASARWFHARMLLSAVAPLSVYVIVAWAIGASPVARAHIEEVAVWNAAFAAGLLALFAFSMPWLLRYSWDTLPLPFGVERELLETIARQARFSCRELLVWRTGNSVANAAILGLLPRHRLVLFSDALISQLSLRELLGVFAHEIGHAKRHHVLVFLAWALAFLLGADLIANAVAANDEMLAGAILLAVLGAWYLSFGWLSRRFELEADLFSLDLIGDAEGLIGALEQVGGAHARSLSSWRHFSTAQRVDFLRATALDRSIGAKLERTLKFGRVVGYTLCAIVLALQGWSLARTWPRDQLAVDLRLGRYEHASEQLAHMSEPDADLARMITRARSQGLTDAELTPEELDRRAQSAIETGDGTAAFELLALAGQRGRDDLRAAAEAIRALGEKRREDALDALQTAPNFWRERLGPQIEDLPAAPDESR